MPVTNLFKLSVLLLVLTANSVSAENLVSPAASVITADGLGKVTVPTTEAAIYCSIELTNISAQKLQTELAAKANAVIAELKKLSPKKLESRNINIYPRYDNKTQKLTDYQGSMSLQVEFPIDKAGPGIDRLIKSGVNRIDSINLFATDEELQEAKQAALQKAVQEAELQIKNVLNTMGLTKGKISEVVLNPDNSRKPMPLYRQAGLMSAENAATPIVAGEQEVSATVMLRYEINK